MNKEEIESPYCEICEHCGDIGCCGIESFIKHHIKGKTNCKNEEWVISDLIDLCEYKDDVFKENKKLKELIDKLKEHLEGVVENFTCDIEDLYDDDKYGNANHIEDIKEQRMWFKEILDMIKEYSK